MNNTERDNMHVMQVPGAQQMCDMAEIMADMDRANTIMYELLERVNALPSDKRWGVVEWSLWSAALTLFFKQFSNNEGRSLHVDYKKVFKDRMKINDYQAYHVFKGLRDGYIAHAGNQISQYKPTVLVKSKTKNILGCGIISLNSNIDENIKDLMTFKDMVNTLQRWTDIEQTKIRTHLLKKVKELGYTTVEKWPVAEFTVPGGIEMRTEKRPVV